MAESRPQLSANLQRISDAIRGHGGPVQAVFCGFDLYIEVVGCEHMKIAELLSGGRFAEGNEPEGTLKVPLLMLGGRIAVSYDPTLPPDQFYLKP